MDACVGNPPLRASCVPNECVQLVTAAALMPASSSGAHLAVEGDTLAEVLC